MDIAPLGRLIVHTPSVRNVGFDLHLSPHPILFGRDNDANDFSVDHESISWRHLLIFTSETLVDGVTVFAVRVQDISSSGAFIHGTKLDQAPHLVVSETVVTLGGTGDDVPAMHILVYKHNSLHRMYQPLTFLGEGASSAVWGARSRQSGRLVAIKCIDYAAFRSGRPVNPSDDPVKREIALMRKYQHEYIIPIYGAVIEEGYVYILMQCASHGCLLDLIQSHEGLNEAYAAPITYQVCSALSYLHSHGVAHRDIKPANILVMNHDPLHVKLADFGLAKSSRMHGDLETVVGTPAYMAPEIVAQEGTYDFLVDSFALGAAVFTMLTNEIPFNNGYDVSRPRLFDRRAIAWGLLPQQTSNEARELLRGLLSHNVAQRWTIRRALSHPWLRLKVQKTQADPLL